MKLNIGCGNHYAAGWTNVDIDETQDVTPDIVGDVVKGLDFPDGSAEKIYLGHILEHLTQEDAVLALLECKRLLQPGGSMMVVGPDCDRADEMLARGEISEIEHDLVVTGAGRWAHDVHLWRSTGPLTEELLHLAGFTPAECPVEEVPAIGFPLTSAVGWQFAYYAIGGNK